MSKLYAYKTGGYDVQSYGPASVEEYDKVAGEGACLLDGVRNEIYRGTIPTLWDTALPLIVSLTGISLGVNEKQTERNRARAKTPEAAAKVKDVPESFDSYLGRVEAKFKDDKDMLAQLEALVKKTALETSIDPSPTSRSRGPGKDYLDKADVVLRGTDEEVEAKVQKWLAIVVNSGNEFDLSRDEATGRPERDSLARLAKAVTDILL